MCGLRGHGLKEKCRVRFGLPAAGFRCSNIYTFVVIYYKYIRLRLKYENRIVYALSEQRKHYAYLLDKVKRYYLKNVYVNYPGNVSCVRYLQLSSRVIT